MSTPCRKLFIPDLVTLIDTKYPGVSEWWEGSP